MEERVVEVLEKNFPGAEVKLSLENSSHKIGGVLLWDGFVKQSFLQRQNKVVRVLKRELGPEMNDILHIFTYTPNEYAQMMSVDEA